MEEIRKSARFKCEKTLFQKFNKSKILLSYLTKMKRIITENSIEHKIKKEFCSIKSNLMKVFLNWNVGGV